MDSGERSRNSGGAGLDPRLHELPIQELGEPHMLLVKGLIDFIEFGNFTKEDLTKLSKITDKNDVEPLLSDLRGFIRLVNDKGLLEDLISYIKGDKTKEGVVVIVESLAKDYCDKRARAAIGSTAIRHGLVA
ncbi:MAG: hypothetical protein MUF85_00220 [Patescibacteria group bacterium]|jgi:uncharacterized protein YeeX (DUF496 family)|nr:hypothetical protein [Patescibacteria group bacterium]